MKRGELVKKINKIAKAQGARPIYTEGGRHTHVQIGDKRTTIPRHSEINELTARGILKYLEGGK
ncbi:MAG: hypothetical protein IE935_09975 [Micrococcales bacterium]|nr:hypothetical protein [Micrococcales bacterium]